MLLGVYIMPSGCPANVANDDAITPQKLAKSEGFKDSMKELKKWTGFQDRLARGSKPKGFSEQWAIRVHLISETLSLHCQLCSHDFEMACCFKMPSFELVIDVSLCLSLSLFAN